MMREIMHRKDAQCNSMESPEVHVRKGKLKPVFMNAMFELAVIEIWMVLNFSF